MEAMADDERAGDGTRRQRGRHAAPTAGASTGDRLRTRLGAAFVPLVAAARPRVASAREWLSARRLPVFIGAATVATIALLGGTIALLQVTGPAQSQENGDGPAAVVDTSRPTSTEPASPGSRPPILPTPVPPSPLPPLPQPPQTSAPEPVDDPAPPPPDDGEPVVEPAPEPSTKPGRDTAPGQTKKPDRPGD
jgi:hypothetical protein